MRILILGGTSEASALAQALASGPHQLLMSMAGRTSKPRPGPTPMRVGGFGGASGLAAFLRAHGADILIDATHPFAVRISANAVAAAAETGTPLLTMLRPPWTPQSGDRWTEVARVGDIAAALGDTPRRVAPHHRLHGRRSRGERRAASPLVGALYRTGRVSTGDHCDRHPGASATPGTLRTRLAHVRAHRRSGEQEFRPATLPRPSSRPRARSDCPSSWCVVRTSRRSRWPLA